MLKVLAKNTVAALLLALLSSQIASAEVKIYQYDGKLPFVQMMLNMMVAMGILDRLPANSAYGGYNNFGGRSGYLSSPLSSDTNLYARALAMRGINPGNVSSAYINNPFLRSSLLQSPRSRRGWNNSSLNNESPVWGNPGWGVLPYENYSSNNYSLYDQQGYDPLWSSYDLNGWANEPWETSEWNPKADKPQQTQTPSLNNAPLVQNFYNLPGDAAASPNAGSAGDAQLDSGQANGQRNDQVRPAQPSSRPSQRSAAQSSQQANTSTTAQSGKPSPLDKQSKKQIVSKRPCITEFCGLKKPNLNGLWVAQNGEMLGLKNNRYLWSDPSERYLTGQMQIQNEYLVANIDGDDRIMRFKYKLAGNRLLTMQPSGRINEFVRMPTNQNAYY